jgi:hypothetical protein
MGADALDNDGLEPPTPRWHGAITWASLAAAGLILYELTNEPAVGVATLCLKFGWEDFKTGYWLRRVDPGPARGRACWWMFVASGLWKTAALAVGVNLVVIPALHVLPNLNGRLPPNRLWEAFKGAGLTSVACVGLSAVATAWAMGVAARNRVRLWLDGSAVRSRRDGLWPPYVAARRPYNRLKILYFSAFVVIVFIGGINVIVHPLRAMGVGENPATGVAFLLVIVGAVYTEQLRHLVVANSPAECWPPDELKALADERF